MKFGIRDLPISRSSEESLGVMPYINSLSQFILSCDTPMTISIQGDWGSGKTSSMMMIKEKIEDEVIPVWFNTWQFSQFENSDSLSLSLISYFVDIIQGQKNDVKNKIGNVLKKLGKVTAIAIGEQTVGSSLTSAFVDNGGITDSAMAIKQLKEQLIEIVNNKLKESNKERIVIFLDDLDRLNPEKAVELLEVLKNFLDIEGCVFVLAVDYAVVVQGIKKKFNTDILDEKGKSFFDKIIQLPFNLPTSLYDSKTYAKNLLNNIKVEYEEKDLDIYVNLVTKSVGFNPRGLKRIFNLFQLLNIVAENQELFNHDKGKKTEKLRVLFALLCLQTGFEKLYIYLSNNLYDLDKELFVLLTDPEMIENDERLQSLRESIGNVDKKYFNKLSSFMEVFYNAVQFDFDDDDDDLSDDELDIIRMLISFSGVTSTDSSGIDSNVAMPKKYTKVRMSGIDTFVKNMREIELESGTKFKGVELAVKVYELAREIFDENDVTYNFTSNGVITISYNKAKGAKKNFIYMDARKVKFLKIFFFNNGKIDWFDVNNKISDFNEINEELKSRMKIAFDCFSGKNI